jgi:putative peptidoglycan lipid II flippase
LNLFGGALTYGVTTALLPIISARLEDSRLIQAGLLNRKVLIGLILPTAVFAAIILLFSNRIISILFERGAFNPSSTNLTATALTMYAGLFISNIYGAVVMKNAFAAKEGWLAVTAAVLMLIVFLSLAPQMIAQFVFVGLPLTTSIAFMTNVLVLSFLMARRHPYLFFRAATSASAVQGK